MLRRLWRHINISIVRKTAYSVASIFLVALLLLSSVSVFMHVSQMQQRVIADKRELSVEIGKGVDSLFQNLSNPLVSLANQRSVRQLLNRGMPLYGSEWMNNIRDIEANLSKMHLYYDYVVDLAILDNDSNILFSLARSFNHNYDFLGSEWFQEALEQPQAVKYAPPHGDAHFYQSNPNPNLFSVIFPVRVNQRVLGYILCEADATKISHVFHDSKLGMREGYLLVDENGRVIYDYVTDRPGEQLQNILAEARERMPHEETPIIRQYDNLYICHRMDSTGWFVLSETAMHVIAASARPMLVAMLAILLASLFLCFVVLRFAMRRLQRPIDHMVRRISSYQGAGPVAFDAKDGELGEILVIREKFEEMAGKIDSLISDVYLAQMHRKDIEMEMLVSQLNPHFLYNALQTVHGEAVLQGNREIEDMISSLSGMLHYTTDHRSEMTTVQQEVQYLHNYLGFYQKRFPQLFVYTIDCEADITAQPMLKYVLQPVVENSIRHGFRDRKQGGVIRVQIYRRKDGIRFEIYDNGYGINGERMAEVRRDMHLALRGPGVGIANTDARIKLKYGPPFGIVLDSVPGEFTRIFIDIPLAPTMEDSDV